MNQCRCLVVLSAAWLAMAGGPCPGAQEVLTNLNQLNALAAAPGVGAALKLKAVVLCYDSGWHQLYLHDGTGTHYFNADNFPFKLGIGEFVELAGTALGGDSFKDLHLSVIGQAVLPPAKRLDLAALAQDHGEWIETAGHVLAAEASHGRLSLLIHDGRQNCLVYVLGGPPVGDIQRWLRCRVRVRGINASRVESARLASAMIFVPGPDEVTVVEAAQRPTPEPAVASIESLLNRELGPWTNQWVHVNGVVAAYQPGRSLLVKDPTGMIRAQVVQMTELRGDERVEVLGFLDLGSQETSLSCAYFRVVHPPASFSPEQPPSIAASSQPASLGLTPIADILKLGREEAARHRPVRLRGVVTFADPEWRNAFIQDRADAIYVYLDATNLAPRSGDWVELTGETSSGGFAPEVLSSRIESLGRTNLPAPPRVDLEDLANGSLDAHWVEMEGVVRRIEQQSGHLSLWLTTPKGRFKVLIPGFDGQPMPGGLIDALVRVQGACTSELNSRRQLSGITLHAPNLSGLTVLDPPPADPFAIATSPIASVGTFNATRPPGARRIKISGIVTLKIAGPGFIVQDASGGVRVLGQGANTISTGDRVEVLGFCAISEFSPYLEEAIFRKTGTGALPERRRLSAEQILMEGSNDAQLVELQGRLLRSVSRAARPQLVLQDGPIIYTACVEPQGPRWDLPLWRSGSLLKISGVCSIQGGERHEPETFRVLIGDARGIALLAAPPWWTSRQAFTAAGAMGLAIMASLAWVGLLRRQVRAQTKLILEISNREQRRIGHDLHDGVCQQLAGISFMSATLADQLGEQGMFGAAQADRISALINEVIDRTRSIARGLFPIWLEENGLVSGLEELAANANEIFKIDCRFELRNVVGEVDSTIALHLYYIALEAVANAAKHGHARNVLICLQGEADPYLLTIQDDGAGFVAGTPSGTGMGLRIMYYRARVVGAKLEVRSQPGSGTKVACSFAANASARQVESAPRKAEPVSRPEAWKIES